MMAQLMQTEHILHNSLDLKRSSPLKNMKPCPMEHQGKLKRG